MATTKELPERIYGWMNSQLSIARFYGGITYQGHNYIIVSEETGAPLVRANVLAREAKDSNTEDKATNVQMAEQQEKLL